MIGRFFEVLAVSVAVGYTTTPTIAGIEGVAAEITLENIHNTVEDNSIIIRAIFADFL